MSGRVVSAQVYKRERLYVWYITSRLLTNQILYFIFEQSDWSMKQEVRDFLRNLSNCWGIVQRNSSKLENELINIFRNASIGTTVIIFIQVNLFSYYNKCCCPTRTCKWHSISKQVSPPIFWISDRTDSGQRILIGIVLFTVFYNI
jgi:hypothetical protein